MFVRRLACSILTKIFVFIDLLKLCTYLLLLNSFIVVTKEHTEFVHDIFDLVCVLQAFFSGKLKLAGNTALAMKLQNIIPRPEGAKL